MKYEITIKIKYSDLRLAATFLYNSVIIARLLGHIKLKELIEHCNFFRILFEVD